MKHAIALALMVGSVVHGQTVVPYPDPSQLDCPWPKHSFYKQPWRGYVETRSGEEFVRGIGVNYHSTGNDAVAIRLLAETGVRAVRMELGFGSMKWDETGLSGEGKTREILKLFKQYNIRPTLLLNAHHGVPCPVKFFKRKATEGAPAGAKTLRLADVSELVIGKSGVGHQSQYWAAAHLITAIDQQKKEVALSRPLTKEIKAGDEVNMATLKFAPLHPVGTPEFEETAAGWVKYALMYCQLASEAGFDDFDIEIWNELSFGSNYTQVRNYYERNDPAAPKGEEFLNPGGCCWELGKRTIDAVKAKYPKVKAIWGFSNTTFHHTPIEKLPPGTDGQTYHPYGTGLRKLPESETHKDRPELNVERYTPTIDIKMPEGWAHTFIQTECLIRHLRPDVRLKTMPPGVKRFSHYMTEHGVVPHECGVKEEKAAWELKAMCATRSYLMWMNKGVDVVHYFQAADKDWTGFGILPGNLKALKADAKWEDVATAPMRAIRHLTEAFSGATRPEKRRELAFDAAELGKGQTIFSGDATHPPLHERDVLAILPWQVNDGKFVVAIYTMSYDATKAVGPTEYRIVIRNVSAKRVKMVDVISGKEIGIKGQRVVEGGVELVVPVTDRAGVVVIEE